MSDVLSSDEVDALLEGVSNGDIEGAGTGFDEKDVSPYDLTATDHIARSDLPCMDLLNQGFARFLKQSFRTFLSEGVEINVGDVTEDKFSDYIATMPEPTMIYLVRLPRMHTQALFVLEAGLVRKYVDIYFGGGTKAMEQEPREGFTSAELRVAEQILDFSVTDFVAAWKPIVPIEAKVTKSESSPQFCKFMESAEPIVISKFDIQLDEENKGSLSCVLPSSMLMPLYEKMDASNRGSQSEQRAAWTAALKERLTEIELTLATPIATKRYSLGKLVRLQVGDIIPIEIDTEVALKAGEVELFRGKFGVSKSKNSVRIDRAV